MKWLAVSALIVATGAAVTVQAFGVVGPMPGVADPLRARQNWILQCQGCHRADATGTPETTPTMAGVIGQFLHVPGGREYLGQVPGVATAALSDAALAEVLNWSLLRFDPVHVPDDFTPYTPAEIGRLRQKPLRAEAAQVRARLLANFTATKDITKK